MTNIVKICSITAMVFLLSGAASCSKSINSDDVAIENARQQMKGQIDLIEEHPDTFLNPTTLKSDGTLFYCPVDDWRSGFFPGAMWYLYELTGDESLLPLAAKYTKAVSDAQHVRFHHDVGFMVGCSFGNALRLTGDTTTYAPAIVEAAKSLCTRFRPAAGVIQSWDVEPGGEREKKGWRCPTIIDNVMNLELLFEATRLSGDSTYYNVAVSHADRTLKEHFRPNGSCYHVIDYDPVSGDVRHRQTAQGCSDESAWARGQSWAIYGFTTVYRYTGDRRYLDRAEKTFDFVKNHPNMPSDLVPYWDLDAPGIPDEPRDVSTAAVIASGLYEMCRYCPDKAKEYKAYADNIMKSLASADYTAPFGENGNFILMHSVTSKPANVEIDVPLNYADYYYLEALKRKRDLEAGKSFK